jgi:hypothetical protein
MLIIGTRLGIKRGSWLDVKGETITLKGDLTAVCSDKTNHLKK